MPNAPLHQLTLPSLRRASILAPGFYELRPEAVSAATLDLIKLADTEFAKLGLKPAATLGCDSSPRMALRGYFRDDGDSWLVAHIDRSGLCWLELFTLFAARDAALLTSQAGTLTDHPTRPVYRSRCQGLDAPDLIKVHERRKEEIRRRIGRPLVTVPTRIGFDSALSEGARRGLWQ